MKSNYAGLALGLAIAAIAVGAQAAPETRCGWIANPTPANWWITDKDGDWTISEQGGYQSKGVGLPDFSTHDWVVTNAGEHGYGCACIFGVFDRKTMRVLNIKSAKQRTLAQCKADKALKPPE